MNSAAPGPFRARLSRQLSLWIFLNFLVVEAIVLVPSVLRQAERLSQQLRSVSAGKIEWILRENPAISSKDLLAAVERLVSPETRGGIRGGALYAASSGEVLGTFGNPPLLTPEKGRTKGRWFPLQQSYEAVWDRREIGGDRLLVVRHDGRGLQSDLIAYVINIALIVMAIAAVLTLSTMLVMHRLVIQRVLQLRQRLIHSGEVFRGGSPPDTDRLLLPEGRADELGDVEQAFNASLLRTAAEMARREKAERRARSERDRAEQLLLNILPAPIAAEMKQGHRLIAETHRDVSVLFADIVGFTALAGRLPCDSLVSFLNEVFSAFDLLCDRYQLEKIKTIGDNYMVVGGLPLPRAGHLEAIAAMALDMQRVITGFRPAPEKALTLRIGIHAGPVVAGVIGRKKFIYDLWGETVNLASRLETNALPGCIQVSAAVRDRLQGQFRLEPRGSIPLKGIGVMDTWWLRHGEG